MDPVTEFLSFVPAKYQAWAFAALVCLKGSDIALQGLKTLFPNNKTIAVLEHWSAAIAPRLPKTLAPPPILKVAAAICLLFVAQVGRAQDLTSGLAVEPLPALGLSFGNPTFYHGPSAPFFELFPGQPHPIQVLGGAGYEVAICDGTLSIGQRTLELACVALNVFLGPQVQLVPELAFFGGVVGVGPVLTPYSFTDQGGFLQGGRPGTGWAFSLCLPLKWL